MLKVENINVYYGAIHAIQGISFEVHQGEIVTLIGANGAGKSTTLKTVSGQLRTRTGSITFMNENISRLDPYKIARKGLVQVPEGRKIFQKLSVEENLFIGGYTRERAEIEATMNDVYQRFPRLKERRRQVAGTLSGGEQQMLAIGRALMSKPRLIMLDEPSMGLAPLLVSQIFSIIRELKDTGVTILLVEQNARMALRIADRAYVLETGRVKLSDSADALLNNDEVQKAYLGG
ncbi:MAG: ABC transporter ATP-binding protein [Eubacteriales bacterium]|nr:ABC transporter ATP-binding protein [Clostridiales bacterium]MDY2770412.1 ABC transporter ATP-binding protein [Eubacteriales bacterium]